MDTGDLFVDLHFSLSKKRTPSLVKGVPPPWACMHVASAQGSLPLKKGMFSVKGKQAQNLSMLCSISAASAAPASSPVAVQQQGPNKGGKVERWKGGEFMQELLLRLLPG